MKTRVEKLLEIIVMAGISVILLTTLCNCQDIIFPDDEEALSHATNRRPVTTERLQPLKVTQPSKVNQPLNANSCPENMIPWQTNGTGSGSICDCKPFFAYFPKTDNCHEAYQRGPCPPQHYVYFVDNDTNASCVPNPCKRDGYVSYHNICHPLREKGGPCAVDEALNVNDVTLELECVGADLIPFVIIEAPHRKDGNCPKGSRRSSLGVCKLVL